MAIAQIQRLIDQSGGFGTYLFMAHEWARREPTLRSYELFAREVMPLFQGSTPSLVGSRDWAAANRPTFIGAAGAAIMKAIQDHHAEKATKSAKAGRPEPAGTQPVQ
jgi:limonene 1,2-monooxygenase